MGDEYSEVKRQLDDMINNHFIDIKRNVYDTETYGNTIYNFNARLGSLDNMISVQRAICDNMKNIHLYLTNKEDYIRLINQLMDIYRDRNLDKNDPYYGFLSSIYYYILNSDTIDRCLKAKKIEHETLEIQFLNSDLAGPNVVRGVSTDVAKVMGSYVNPNVLPNNPKRRRTALETRLDEIKRRRGGKYSKRHKKTKRNKKYKTKKNRK